MRREEAPVCVARGAVITVKHTVIECTDLLEIRKKYFEERSLYSLFRNVIPEFFFFFFFGFVARDWFVLQNMKCIKVMLVLSVFKELCKMFMWGTFYNLFNE